MGGNPGATSSFWRNPDSEHAEDLGNTDVVNLDPGDIIRIKAAGGAGWGPAWEREPALVLRDIAEGKVSVEAAARDYGVVLRDGALDMAGTEAARARLAREAGARAPSHFRFNPARDAYERDWTDASYAALSAVLGTLPIHWRHFVKRRIFDRVAAMRPEDRRPDGSHVRAIFTEVVSGFPELRHIRPAAE
jgi:N-methylhydantoinase B